MATERLRLPSDGLCVTGKMRYSDAATALRALGMLRDIGVNVVRAYPCPWCGCWHLTSQREVLT